MFPVFFFSFVAITHLWTYGPTQFIGVYNSRVPAVGILSWQGWWRMAKIHIFVFQKKHMKQSYTLQFEFLESWVVLVVLIHCWVMWHKSRAGTMERWQRWDFVFQKKHTKAYTYASQLERWALAVKIPHWAAQWSNGRAGEALLASKKNNSILPKMKHHELG